MADRTADSSIKLGGGRVADQIASMTGVQNVATAIAVNGRSSFQQGATVTPFLGVILRQFWLRRLCEVYRPDGGRFR